MRTGQPMLLVELAFQERTAPMKEMKRQHFDLFRITRRVLSTTSIQLSHW